MNITYTYTENSEQPNLYTTWFGNLHRRLCFSKTQFPNYANLGSWLQSKKLGLDSCGSSTCYPPFFLTTHLPSSLLPPSILPSYVQPPLILLPFLPPCIISPSSLSLSFIPSFLILFSLPPSRSSIHLPSFHPLLSFYPNSFLLPSSFHHSSLILSPLPSYILPPLHSFSCPSFI